MQKKKKKKKKNSFHVGLIGIATLTTATSGVDNQQILTALTTFVAQVIVNKQLKHFKQFV